ncbi:DUF2381 family protein [Corallococcus terminator]
MLQPFRLVLPLTLALAWGAAAQAQPATGARVDRKRSVTIASTPAEPLPVIHVAADTRTVFLFSAPIQRRTLTFDESRIRVLDAGERSIIVQPVANLADGERQELGVFFADGQVPTRAAFVLVTDPSNVDALVDVQRPEPPNAACQPTAKAPAPRPEDFVLLGYVDKTGVTTTIGNGVKDAAQGLSSPAAVAFRGTGWILMDVVIKNGRNHPAWTPQEATFLGRDGIPLRARLVAQTLGAIPAGKERQVLAVVEVPETKSDLVFTLEVVGDGGRRLTIPDVRFPQPRSGGTP